MLTLLRLRECGLARTLADELRSRELIDSAFLVGFVMILAAVVALGLKMRPGDAEMGVALGITAVYIMVFPDLNFVHVEVFDLEAPGDVQTLDELVVHPSVAEWGLPSEPWVFVVGAAGIVTGRFEGVETQEEIEVLL